MVKSNLAGITSHKAGDAFSRSQMSTKGPSKSNQSRVRKLSSMTSGGQTDGHLLPQLMPLIQTVHAIPFPPQTPWLSSFFTGRSLPALQYIAFLNSCYLVLLYFPLFSPPRGYYMKPNQFPVSLLSRPLFSHSNSPATHSGVQKGKP